MLIDAVVHAVNEDYEEMAGDFIKLGFLTPGVVADILAYCHSLATCVGQIAARVTMPWHAASSPFGRCVYVVKQVDVA